MRIGILGQPCIDEIISQDGKVRSRSLGGILYSYAAMERLMRSGGMENQIVPITWNSLHDESILAPFLNRLQHLERTSGLWTTSMLTNRVQLVYTNTTDRTEHCPTILPPISEQQLTSILESGLDGLFVNMISGFDVKLDVLKGALDAAAKRPFVHLDIHALILGDLSSGSAGAFGAGRTPRPIERWKEWIALADSVQLNQLELELIAKPECTSEREFVWMASAIARKSRLKYLVVTRAAEGATVYDLLHQKTFSVEPRKVKVVEPTGSGDVFGSAFLFALMTKARPHQALQQAVAMATWNATLGSIEEILASRESKPEPGRMHSNHNL